VILFSYDPDMERASAEVDVADIKALGELALKVNGLRGVKANETVVGF
jgi:hypothetical protein